MAYNISYEFNGPFITYWKEWTSLTRYVLIVIICKIISLFNEENFHLFRHINEMNSKKGCNFITYRRNKIQYHGSWGVDNVQNKKCSKSVDIICVFNLLLLIQYKVYLLCEFLLLHHTLLFNLFNVCSTIYYKFCFMTAIRVPYRTFLHAAVHYRYHSWMLSSLSSSSSS